MKSLVEDEARKLNELLQKALSCFELLSHVPTVVKSDDYVHFDDLGINEVAKERIDQLYNYENKLKLIENTSQLFDSKDISLLRRAHKSTLAVCEHLLPNKDTILRDRSADISTPEFRLFINTFQKLCMQTKKYTNSTVQEIEEQAAFASDLTDKIRLLEETKRTLTIRLASAIERKEKIDNELNAEVMSLQSELNELTQSNTKELELGYKEEVDSIEQITIEHQRTTECLLTRLRDLQAEYDGLVEANYQKESLARSEKALLQEQFTQKEQEHLTEITLLTTEAAELEAAFERDTIEYAQLKKHFDAADAQLAQQEREQSVMQSFHQLQDDAEKALVDAAKVIQKMIRGRKARLAVEALKAKKTAGKGKGKSKGAGAGKSKPAGKPPKIAAKKK